MIEIRNLTKVYRLNGTSHKVADNLSVTFPSNKSVALLGANGAGKSSLLNMISGSVHYDSGTIKKTGAISWPVGYAGSFHKELTGVQNVRFLARVYGIDTDDLIEFVRDFAELGKHFNLPLESYSSGMRSRLSFGVSMGVKFDTYLVDEVMAVGDARFKNKCRLVMKERLQDSGAIIVSHSTRQISELCDSGAVLKDGKVTYFEDVQDALDLHHKNMEQAGERRSRIDPKQKQLRKENKKRRLEEKLARLAAKKD
ncbi:ATP-binding protein [Amylibacter ulvae]|uniref:ATP-binding protein n=1 Tax=Paramylibacter ulvae TaxID=1651968 RepID=A0ABQ3CXA3_9RHOB|nr:ABC transporter ATP-binding protein [Amylibacter ulvae]GHA48315.1 ATP-binding protein [Amylibacter ulvae]